MRCSKGPQARDDRWHEPLDTLENKIESRFGSVDRRFDALAEQLHGCQGHMAELLRQLQDQLRAMESSNGHALLQLHGRLPSRAGSARGPALSHREDGKVPSVLKEDVQYVNGEAEMVPLLSQDAPGGAGDMTFQEKLKLAQESMHAGTARQSWAVKAVTSFLEDPESSVAASWYGLCFTIFNVIAIVIGLLPSMDIKIWNAETVDLAIDAVLLLEITVRFTFCPNVYAFLMNPANLIDFLSGIPLLTQLLFVFGEDVDSIGQNLILCTGPVIRLLRLVRRFPQMQILITAFQNCVEALPVLLYTMAVLAVFFTSMIFLAEPRNNVVSMSEAGWLVLSTMTTVGYGDITPCTTLGHALTSVLMIVSPLYMAMPFGIIGVSFTEIWKNRSKIMLLQGTRDRLAKWGFGAFEIPRLFQLFDLDSSAELDLDEFKILLNEMEVGFREEDMVELFKVIDKDSGGTIDEKEFVKTLYPNEYRQMYAVKKHTHAA